MTRCCVSINPVTIMQLDLSERDLCHHCHHPEAAHAHGRGCTTLLCRCSFYRPRTVVGVRTLGLGGALSERRCRHRARVRELERAHGYLRELERCRCGATRTRTLLLDGSYEITPWVG